MVRSICAMRVLSHDGDATVVVADMSLCNLQHPSLCLHSSSQQPAGPACLHVFAPTCRLGIDSIDKLRSKLGEMRGELQDPHRFQEVYNYSFQWACEVRQGGLAADLLHVPWFGGGGAGVTHRWCCVPVCSSCCVSGCGSCCVSGCGSCCVSGCSSCCVPGCSSCCVPGRSSCCVPGRSSCCVPGCSSCCVPGCSSCCV
jgi:hypothetical protein